MKIKENRLSKRKIIVALLFVVLSLLVGISVYTSFAYVNYIEGNIAVQGVVDTGSKYEIIIEDETGKQYTLNLDNLNSLCSKGGAISTQNGKIVIDSNYQEVCDIYLTATIVYDINYHFTDGSFIDGYEPPLSYQGGSEINLPTSEYVVTNNSELVFYGWYDNPEFTGEVITKITAEDTGDKDLYAKIDSPMVTYVMYNSEVPTNTQLITQLPFNLYVPTREGYTFQGYREILSASRSAGYGTKDLTQTLTNPNSTYPMTWTGSEWQSSNQGVNNSKSCGVSEVFNVGSGGGTLTFDWHSYGETNYDYLIMDVVNTQTGASISGRADIVQYFTTTSWNSSNYSYFLMSTRGSSSSDYASKSVIIPSAGAYQAYFCYGKDGSTNSNDDTGYIKNIKVTNTFTEVVTPNLGDVNYGTTLNLEKKRNITLTDYNSWQANTYYITYVLNGGTQATSGVPTSYTYNVGATITGEPTKSGKVFMGWCTDASLTTCSKTINISKIETGNKTYYAKFISLDVTYKMYEGTVSSTKQEIDSFPATLYTPTGPGTFKGWREYTGETTTVKYLNMDLTDSATNPNSTYPMTWTGSEWKSSNQGIDNSKSCIVTKSFTLDSNGGTITFDWHSYGESSYDYLIMDVINTQTGTSIKGTTNAVNYFTTTNWSSGNSSYVSLYTKGSASSSYSSKTLSISSAGTYKAYFCYGKDSSQSQNDDTGHIKNIVVHNVPMSVTIPTVGSTNYGTSITSPMSGELTLTDYGQWGSYKISYVLNGGTQATSGVPTSYTAGTTTTISGVPTKTGYTFVGWCRDAALNYCSATQTISSSEKESLTFYAKYKANTYKVEYYSYDGTVKYGESTHTYGSYSSLTSYSTLGATPPTSDDGYTKSFYGWATSANSTSRSYSNGQSVSNLVSTNNGVKKLYAIWNRSITVSYYSTSSSRQTSSTCSYYNTQTSCSITTVSPSSISGMTALGWSTSTSISVGWFGMDYDYDYDIGESITLTSNKTLYAVYKGTIRLSYNANGGKSTPSSTSKTVGYNGAGKALYSGNYDNNSFTLAAAISKDHYSFNKWAKGSTSGELYDAGSTIKLTQNTTMYATWDSNLAKMVMENSVAESAIDSTTMTKAIVQDENGDYRYLGANPDNYVQFNNELWRIIGVFSENTHGKTGQKLVKIVRNSSLGSYAYDSNSKNDWSNATLKTSLNGSSYNYASDPLVETVTWHLGGTANYTSSSNGLPSHFYGYERGTTVYSGNSTTWNGKVGLIYPSDIGYAALGNSTTSRETCLAKELYNWDSLSNCRTTDWLAVSQRTITPASGSDSNVYYYNGSYLYNTSSSSSYTVKPALYLKANTYIKSGTGTSTDPYILESKLIEGDLIGYYADTDNNGSIEGVIFFDYMYGADTTAGLLGTGVAVEPITEGLNTYELKTVEGHENVVVPTSSDKQDRFYVIDLEDSLPTSPVSSKYAYWYYSAYTTKINDYATVTSDSFGSGKTNTSTMKTKWNTESYGAKNNGDMWTIDMGEKFVPSKDEWLVLGSNLKKIATGAYSNMTFPSGSTLSFSNYYWSSSLSDTKNAWYSLFSARAMSKTIIVYDHFVRLALTF